MQDNTLAVGLAGRKVIDEFTGRKYEFLSNFYPSPFTISVPHIDDSGEPQTRQITFPTVEHAFQCQKTLDLVEQDRIAVADTAGLAKRIGRSVCLRYDWEQIKLDVMRNCVREKFLQNSHLMLQLVSTGNAELIEGNTWRDRFWGKTKDGIGSNHLGLILMSLRDEFIAEADFSDRFAQFLIDNDLNLLSLKVQENFEEFNKLFAK